MQWEGAGAYIHVYLERMEVWKASYTTHSGREFGSDDSWRFEKVIV